MKQVWIIASHEFRVMVRRPVYIILTILIPLLALAGILIYSAIASRAGGEAKSVTYGFVDQAGIVKGFYQQNNITFEPFTDTSEGSTALLNGHIKLLYVILPDYTSTGDVVEYTTQKGLDLSNTPNQPLEEFLVSNLLSGEPAQVRDRVAAPALVTRVQLDKEGQIVAGIDVSKAIFFFVLGILLIIAIFISSGYLLSGIGEEKENRVIEILMSSVTPGQLMVGKILGLGASGLLQMLVWVLAGWGLLSLATSIIGPLASLTLPGASALLGILYFLLGFLFFATVFAGLGALTSTAKESQQLSALFIVPAIIPYYAYPYILSHPDGAVARFLSLFPLTSSITVMERLGTNTIATWEIAASALILAAVCVLGMWLAVRVFRAYLLMYGKRPGLKEVWETLRRQ